MLFYHHTPQQFYGPFFRDHPGEPVPEENFWTLWCKVRLTEPDTSTIRQGATPSGLSSAHLHHPPFVTGQMPFLPPNQQCQSIRVREKTQEFSSTVLPAPSPYCHMFFHQNILKLILKCTCLKLLMCILIR